MGGQQGEVAGPDWEAGVAWSELGEGAPLLGHIGGESVIVVRRGDQAFAIGATCSHYGGPLAEGLVVGDEIRCPWHHACFNLRTGEAERAPALSPVACYATERRGDKLHVIGKTQAPPRANVSSSISRVVIVGAGAASQAAAETLRQEGFSGEVTILSEDNSGPVDRPNLSKDYLAGNAPEEWIPLRPPEFYADKEIRLELGVKATGIDVQNKTVMTESGKQYPYDALLLATGAEPNKLSIPGAALPHVHYLRSIADSRSIIERSASAKHAVVIGGSFIALETAAALRTRSLDVHVVAPESRPLETVMGREIGDLIRALHEEHGVVFHLETSVRAIDEHGVTLTSGETIAADLVVAGIGVKPRIELGERSGLSVDRGLVVNEFLETSSPGIYAAGDIARWPDPHTGQPIRVEHWVVAERHGQIAAKNILGQKVPCRIVPFFWSQHYDVAISYVGHAKRWDRTDVAGDLAQRDCTVALRSGQRTLAVITIGRDFDSLRAEAAFENGDVAALAAFGL